MQFVITDAGKTAKSQARLNGNELAPFKFVQLDNSAAQDDIHNPIIAEADIVYINDGETNKLVVDKTGEFGFSISMALPPAAEIAFTGAALITEDGLLYAYARVEHEGEENADSDCGSNYVYKHANMAMNLRMTLSEDEQAPLEFVYTPITPEALYNMALPLFDGYYAGMLAGKADADHTHDMTGYATTKDLETINFDQLQVLDSNWSDDTLTLTATNEDGSKASSDVDYSDYMSKTRDNTITSKIISQTATSGMTGNLDGQIQSVHMIGERFSVAEDGSDTGNSYGLIYIQNVHPAAPHLMAGLHNYAFAHNGEITAALGTSGVYADNIYITPDRHEALHDGNKHEKIDWLVEDVRIGAKVTRNYPGGGTSGMDFTAPTGHVLVGTAAGFDNTGYHINKHYHAPIQIIVGGTVFTVEGL